MRRVNADATAGPSQLRIAHRTPVSVDPGRALDWGNLLGSCSHDTPTPTCDIAQEHYSLQLDPTDRTSVARLSYQTRQLEMDPTQPTSVAQVSYERRGSKNGLFLTSSDPVLASELEDVLNLNAPDLAAARQSVWKAFEELARKHVPGRYGREARLAYLSTWLSRTPGVLPEFAGVVENKVNSNATRPPGA